MAKNSQRRIDRDIKVCLQSDLYKFVVNEDDANLCYFIFTPTEGYYEGHTHVVEIKLKYGVNPEYKYPAYAPLCTFITPIWHPNIGEFNSGIICVDILKDAWTPMMSLDNICSTITLLLLEPNPDSPQNTAASREYLDDRSVFAETARQYYDKHGGAVCVANVVANQQPMQTTSTN